VNGVERITAERKRQIEECGYTAKYDDFWDKGEIVQAAMCYCMEPGESRDLDLIDIWPWNISFWEPTPNNRIHELEKAGALIAAEIDRLLRKEAQSE